LVQRQTIMLYFSGIWCNTDCNHHGPFTFFMFFYAETFKKLGVSGRETVKLDVSKKYAMEKDKRLRCTVIWS